MEIPRHRSVEPPAARVPREDRATTRRATGASSRGWFCRGAIGWSPLLIGVFAEPSFEEGNFGFCAAMIASANWRNAGLLRCSSSPCFRMNTLCGYVNFDAFMRSRASPSQGDLAESFSFRRSRFQGAGRVRASWMRR